MNNDPLAPFFLDPKGHFLRSEGWIKSHNDYAEGTPCQAALGAAYAKMALDLSGNDAIVRSHNASMLEGAKRFVSIFLNIGRPTKEIKEPEFPQLKPLK